MTDLIDTDVLIDILRGTPAAQTWLSGATSTVFAIPGVVAMEMLVGCRNRNELQKVQRFLGSFTIVWTEATEFAHAYDLLMMHQLTSGVSIPDCIIAAMAITRSVTLYSFNIRHFRIISGLDVQEPYQRS
ncbi:MAG: type II toxin-antitoxin system VapC family toxin [Chloroflexaceae bacterium]